MAGGDQKSRARRQLKVFFGTDRLGSKAKVPEPLHDVRFSPESRCRLVGPAGAARIRCYGISRQVADLQSSPGSNLENERGQLIERVGKLHADEN